MGVLIDLGKPSRGSYLTVETDGDIYPCAFFILTFINSEKREMSPHAVPYSPKIDLDVSEISEESEFDQIMISRENCKDSNLYILKNFELIE